MYVLPFQARFEVNIPELPESIDVSSYMQQVWMPVMLHVTLYCCNLKDDVSTTGIGKMGRNFNINMQSVYY